MWVVGYCPGITQLFPTWHTCTLYTWHTDPPYQHISSRYYHSKLPPHSIFFFLFLWNQFLLTGQPQHSPKFCEFILIFLGLSFTEQKYSQRNAGLFFYWPSSPGQLLAPHTRLGLVGQLELQLSSSWLWLDSSFKCSWYKISKSTCSDICNAGCSNLGLSSSCAGGVAQAPPALPSEVVPASQVLQWPAVWATCLVRGGG